MRGMRNGFSFTRWAVLFLGISVIGAVSASGSSESLIRVGIGVAVIVAVGVLYLCVSRYIGGKRTVESLKPDGSLDTPITGTALVTSVRDTGMLINNVNLVAEVGLQVTLPGVPPYDAMTRHVMAGRTQWGVLQPGMTVSVLVNRQDLTKVVINTEAASAAPQTGEQDPSTTAAS